MKTTARVIVTRPEPDAGHWARQLEAAGIAAEALALIDIAPASGPAPAQALSNAWQALDSYAACMFVSGHAVAHFFKPNTASAQSPSGHSAINTVAGQAPLRIPPGLRFLAPGPGTVAALRAAGVAAAQIDAPPLEAVQFDSEALWRVIGTRDWRGRKVLIVRGHSAGAQGPSSGRDWIARQWQDAGANVEFVGVYQRCAPCLTPAQTGRARQASADGSVWLFSSSEAVANLLGQPGLQGVDWRRARAVATHPRIAQAVRQAGWGVVAESRPALQDIARTLGSIESLHS